MIIQKILDPGCRVFRLLPVFFSVALATVDTRAGDPTSQATEPRPYLLKPEGHQFTLLKNWTFGKNRPEATVRNKSELDQEFYYRYIWERGKLDKLKTYWSYHPDYPDDDPKSVHVFSDDALTLKGRIPAGGGLRDRGIESGLLRGKFPITPGMFIEMRAKLPGGVGVWPSFWLGEGLQSADGKISPPPKSLPEIDIFEFFNWDGRPQTRIMVCNIQTFGGSAAYGHPRDYFTLLQNAGYERHLDLGFDCSKDFHVFALDWVENQPIWLLDGKPIKQTYYEWHGSPGHILVTNAIGMNLRNVTQKQMTAEEKQWDYVIDYIRVWEHRTTPGQKLVGPTPYPRKEEDLPGKGVGLGKTPVVPARSTFWVERDKAQGAVVFVGDSTIDGWKDLAQAFPNLKAANRSIRGDVSRSVLFRFQEDVLDLSPKAVVVEIGANDLKATGKPEDILSNLTEIVSKAETAMPRMPIILCSIPPKLFVKSADHKALNEGIARLASEHKNTQFCDLFTALANADGSPNPEFFTADKLQLSGPGYARWAELLRSKLEKL